MTSNNYMKFKSTVHNTNNKFNYQIKRIRKPHDKTFKHLYCVKIIRETKKQK